MCYHRFIAHALKEFVFGGTYNEKKLYEQTKYMLLQKIEELLPVWYIGAIDLPYTADKNILKVMDWSELRQRMEG